MRVRLLSSLGLAVLLLIPACTDDAPRHKAGDFLGDYPLEGVSGLRVRTSELASRVLLIHFFETDSGECRAQVGRIKSLWFPRKAAGMNVLGICPETGERDLLGTVKDWGIPYPVFLDPERAFTHEFAPRKYPWNVVVGRDGKLLLSEKGNWDRVQAAVDEALRMKVEGPDHVRVQHLVIAFAGSVPG